VEAYLLDYEGELREQKLRIDLLDKLRDEKHSILQKN
jgi:FAD synthase